MSSFCLLNCELLRDNLEIPPYDYRRASFDQPEPLIGHGNYAIATLELIFNSAIRRQLHSEFVFRFGLLEYRSLRTVHRLGQWAHFRDFNSIERSARQGIGCNTQSTVMHAGAGHGIKSPYRKPIFESERFQDHQ